MPPTDLERTQKLDNDTAKRLAAQVRAYPAVRRAQVMITRRNQVPGYGVATLPGEPCAAANAAFVSMFVAASDPPQPLREQLSALVATHVSPLCRIDVTISQVQTGANPRDFANVGPFEVAIASKKGLQATLVILLLLAAAGAAAALQRKNKDH